MDLRGVLSPCHEARVSWNRGVGEDANRCRRLYGCSQSPPGAARTHRPVRAAVMLLLTAQVGGDTGELAKGKTDLSRPWEPVRKAEGPLVQGLEETQEGPGLGGGRPRGRGTARGGAGTWRRWRRRLTQPLLACRLSRVPCERLPGNPA